MVWDRCAAALLTLHPGAEAGFDAQESLMDLRQSHRGLGAAVQAGWGDGGGYGLLDKFIDALVCVWIQVGLGKQNRDAFEARLKTFPVILHRT